MCAGALLAICVAAKDVWLVRRDWNALGVSGTKHTVDDMEQCYHTANEGGHKQWSFAQDSHHCYISDNMHWGGSALKGVTILRLQYQWAHATRLRHRRRSVVDDPRRMGFAGDIWHAQGRIRSGRMSSHGERARDVLLQSSLRPLLLLGQKEGFLVARRWPL